MSADTNRATIRDVAQRAGVAVSTVSRYLSGGYCGEGTRERVEQAIAELSYRPNEIARGLVRRETRTIGLVIPDITNPYFPALTRGVEDCARAAGYSVLLTNTDSHLDLEADAVRMLLAKQVDGLILTTAGSDASHIQSALTQNVPVVVMDRRINLEGAATVGIDNLAGARRAVEYLISLGHRRIAYLGGVPGLPVDQERDAGYRLALRAAGIPLDAGLIEHGKFKFDEGYAAALRLLSRRPTAVFAANDLMALGVLKAAREVGIEVPSQLSVVGFDDILSALTSQPALTTVRQPAYDVGYRAAELLVRARQGLAPVSGEVTLFQPELIIRESTGTPAAP